MTDLGRIRLRFFAWILVAVGLSVGQAAWLITRGSTNSLVIGMVIFTTLIAGMVWLLATTPPRAVRLRARKSVLVVMGVSAGLQTLELLTDHDARGASVVFGIVVVALVGWLVARCVRNGVSPWWAAVVGWSPWVLVGW